MAEQIIPCPKGCAPERLNLGTAPKTLRWRFTGGNGSINEVQGLPDPPFSGGHNDGDDYVVDYAGNTPGDLTWSYAVRSTPSCPNKAQPQIGTGPG